MISFNKPISFYRLLLVVVAGGPGGPGGAEGEGDGGEQLGQVLHGPHHHPGAGLVPLALLAPRRRPVLDDGDPAVLVDREPPEVAGLPGLPHLVEDVVPGGGELEVEVDLVLGEVGVLHVLPLVGDHAGHQGLPAGVRGMVDHPDNVGVLLPRQGVEGHHGGGRQVGARLGLEHPGHALRLGLHIPIVLHARPQDFRGTRHFDVALHTSLPRLIHLLLQFLVIQL